MYYVTSFSGKRPEKQIIYINPRSKQGWMNCEVILKNSCDLCNSIRDQIQWAPYTILEVQVGAW